MSAPVLVIDRGRILVREGDDVSRTLGRLAAAQGVPGAGALIKTEVVMVVAEAADITPALTAWMTGGAT